MAAVTHHRPEVSPTVIAGLLLAAVSELRRLALPHPTTDALLAATGAGRSRAYALKDRILALLPELSRPVGRPAALGPAVPSNVAATISQRVLRFVADHPGAISGGRRRRYSDGFRHFVLELCDEHRDVELKTIAEASCVPLGTLKDWLSGGNKDATEPATQAAVASTDPVTSGRVQMVVEQWRRWDGSFSDFYRHVSFELRIPFGRSLISSILEQHGERTPRRRSGRSPDEKALRGAFETFFAGAQWEGDGTPIAVQVGDQRFAFNLELNVDANTSAIVGASIRDEEDSAAVVEAFEDGVQTTGAPPLAELLDNRSCNHTVEVDDGLGDVIRIRATKGRGQSKAHVEGAFGLFAQVVPLLAITATAPKKIARQVLWLVVQTWGRTLNHRPRRDRGGSSRVDLYTNASPTPDQIEQARLALQQRRKRQEQARRTLTARQDPVVRRLLDDAFARLGIDDPTGSARSAIARYPLDAVVNGVASFEGKRLADTLPKGVDGRYLLGIVKNISATDEGLMITETLLRLRIEARDQLLIPLQRSLDDTLRRLADPLENLKTLIDRALAADRQLDRVFWLGAAADLIADQHDSRHTALLRFAARRIHATFSVPVDERQPAVRFLCSRVIPLR